MQFEIKFVIIKVNEIIQGLQLQFYEDLFPTRSRFIFNLTLIRF